MIVSCLDRGGDDGGGAGLAEVGCRRVFELVSKQVQLGLGRERGVGHGVDPGSVADSAKVNCLLNSGSAS